MKKEMSTVAILRVEGDGSIAIYIPVSTNTDLIPTGIYNAKVYKLKDYLTVDISPD